MKYIFCNSNKEINTFNLPNLSKKDNIIYHKGPISSITQYYSNNTIIVLPFIEAEFSDTFKPQRKQLNNMLEEHGMNLYDIGTAVWTPIDEDTNYGIAFTSGDNIYWAYTSVVGLADKFSFDINTIIFDVHDFDLTSFESQITKAMNTKKKLDFAPEICDIYYNP